MEPYNPYMEPYDMCMIPQDVCKVLGTLAVNTGSWVLEPYDACVYGPYHLCMEHNDVCIWNLVKLIVSFMALTIRIIHLKMDTTYKYEK